MRNEPWVWPEVRDAGTSGAGAVPLRSAQMMGQQKKKKSLTFVRCQCCHLLEIRSVLSFGRCIVVTGMEGVSRNTAHVSCMVTNILTACD